MLSVSPRTLPVAFFRCSALLCTRRSVRPESHGIALHIACCASDEPHPPFVGSRLPRAGPLLPAVVRWPTNAKVAPRTVPSHAVRSGEKGGNPFGTLNAGSGTTVNYTKGVRHVLVHARTCDVTSCMLRSRTILRGILWRLSQSITTSRLDAMTQSITESQIGLSHEESRQIPPRKSHHTLSSTITGRWRGSTGVERERSD
jgi:hypothetical protein